MGNKISLQEELINLKMTSKQMRSASKKCEKNEKVAKTNVKKAIEKGNMEGARIYAQNAIREKTQGLNYLKMSSRIDAVGQRLETAIRTNDMSKAMGNVVKGMASALQSMDVEKISRVMDSFEQQFESMDVRAGYMESSMNSTTASATPEDQVDGLISQIADEHQLDVSFALDDAGTMGTKVPAQPAKKEDADLASRLDALNR
ncbi:Snf7 family [Pelagophyceae sp. CCMP2097]|nr:Snf7 family [Pelagophyceae sp. CCMP2097]